MWGSFLDFPRELLRKLRLTIFSMNFPGGMGPPPHAGAFDKRDIEHYDKEQAPCVARVYVSTLGRTYLTS